CHPESRPPRRQSRRTPHHVGCTIAASGNFGDIPESIVIPSVARNLQLGNGASGQPAPASSHRLLECDAVKRRTLLQALPAATLFPALWAGAQRDNVNPKGASTMVYELRVYRAAPGKLAELLARFRDHTIKLFDRHGMKSVAYWTAVDEPQKSDTLVYILQH